MIIGNSKTQFEHKHTLSTSLQLLIGHGIFIRWIILPGIFVARMKYDTIFGMARHCKI